MILSFSYITKINTVVPETHGEVFYSNGKGK